MVSNMLLATLLFGLTTIASATTNNPDCSNDADCHYNGACKQGTCACSTQWRGTHCEELNLLPARRDGGFRSPHASPATATSSWGGSVLHDPTDGRWHMFAAEMAEDCSAMEPNEKS